MALPASLEDKLSSHAPYDRGRRQRSSARSSAPAPCSRNRSNQPRRDHVLRSSSREAWQSFSKVAAARFANGRCSISWLASRFHLKLQRSKLLDPIETQPSHSTSFACSTRGWNSKMRTPL